MSHEAEAAARARVRGGGGGGASLAVDLAPALACGEAPTAIPVASLVRAIVLARSRGAETGALAAAFHEGLAARLAAVATLFARRLRLASVVLTGGCLQNRLLLETLRARLVSSGLEVLTHRRLPPGDGGLAAGQAVVAVAREARAALASPAPRR